MPKRRGRNEGGLFYSRSKKRWVARWKGQERVGKSKTDAQYKLRELQNSTPRIRSKLTVSDFLRTWLAGIQENRRPSTYYNYETTWRVHIKPWMGELFISDLNAAHVEQWLRELPPGTGDRTRHNAFKILNAALNAAVKKKVISSNPCQDVERPRYEPEVVDPFTIDEIRQILTAVSGHRLEALFRLALTVGMRQGELFGLKWKDIDFAGQELHIRHQNAEVRGKVYYQTTKTKAGRRTIPLDEALIAALNNRRRHALKEGFVQDGDWVFPLRSGKAITRSSFARWPWRRILKNLNIRHRGMHQCRHTAFTMMLNAGESVKTVATLAGHSKPSVTLNIYARYTQEAGIKAVSGVSQAIGG